jgi:hypothetical protein
MAAVLDALAPYVKKLIMDMAGQELSMVLGVSDQINKLGDKVERLEAYAADAERRRIDDTRVQTWVSKLKGALYEATDILELCQLDAEERRDIEARVGCLATLETMAPGCLLPLLFCLREPGFAHTMGSRIKDLNTRLQAIWEEMADLRLHPLSHFPFQTPPSESTPPSRTTTSLFDGGVIVGEAIKFSTKALVQELLLANNPQAMKVVSITAAGGMGKTTLAKKIFNDRDIQAEFRCRIWLCVTESYSHEKLLCSAITQARGGDNPHGDQQVLTQTLVGALSEAGKFLLVLDDVWSNRPWHDILQSPVIEAGRRQPGSRVIITTRKKDLVEDMGATYYLHHVKPLSDEDAWTLLKKQLLPLQVHIV